MLRVALLAAVSLLAATPALAQQNTAATGADVSRDEQVALDRAANDAQARTGQPPQRIRSVQLVGGQKCPESTATEVVVCRRIDPNEQYRVPKELRGTLAVPAQNQSWVNRTAAADAVGRTAGGVPNSCSAVGTAGQTGCAVNAARVWAAEKRQQQREINAANRSGSGDDAE